MLFLFFLNWLLVILKLLQKHKYNFLNLVLRHRLEIDDNSISFIIYYLLSLKFLHLLLKQLLDVLRDVIKIYFTYFFLLLIFFVTLFPFFLLLLLVFLLNNIDYLLSIHINLL
jgi:hypothetical protein